MKLVTISSLFIFLASARGRGGGPKPTVSISTTNATTETSTITEDASYDDSDMEATVKALIDTATCDEISSNSNCGGDAAGYYHSFEYDGNRIVISSGAPDHDAEYDQVTANPNSRCKLHWDWFDQSCPLSTRDLIHLLQGDTG